LVQPPCYGALPYAGYLAFIYQGKQSKLKDRQILGTNPPTAAPGAQICKASDFLSQVDYHISVGVPFPPHTSAKYNASYSGQTDGCSAAQSLIGACGKMSSWECDGIDNIVSFRASPTCRSISLF
jgi:hypothetical protein